ncbi:MAG TPA: HAD family phosphatase [Chthoniobacterales bacterium]|jgi:putative hydrolase of the HAD superfamily
MLQALIFDIGNVLLEFDFRHAYEKLENLSDGFNPDSLAEVERLKTICEAGGIDRATFENAVVEVLRFRGTPSDFSAIWADIFTINQPMVDFVESLHRKLPLFLLSNTSAIHLEHILEKYPVFGSFDDAIYSHEVRLAKPDPAIFQLAAERFKVDPAHTGFIDDLLPNIESARGVGFRGFHYEAAQHGAFLSEIQSLL